MREFSKTLCALRKARGLSQRAVAAELEISQALLSHYEKGIREPGLDFVRRACRFYGISADYLLGLTETPERYSSRGLSVELRKIADCLEQNLATERELNCALKEEQA
ncbi:MAG: helix-turn-helix transcriptional regulator [Oscillospiraceae bacterium]|nr:helix-turn-helix transcriptional regulator [Oscillospiraceae bacterium]